MKNNNNYSIISNSEFTELAKKHDQHCISIYIPTSRAGEMVDKKLGQISLKNELKKLKSELKEYQLKDHEIDNLLYPATNLLSDYHFWRNQSDCLVIFLSQEGMHKYSYPIDQEQKSYIADHFYLLPLIPLLNQSEKFFILSISLKKVEFFEATAHTITYIHIEDLVPEKLEEVVGYDFEDRGIQFRSAHKNSTVFHGQGSGKDDKEVEVEKFLKAVDQGVMTLLKNEKAPLILACVDHYAPVYRKISAYSHIYHSHISGNHDESDPLILHELAWPLIKPLFDEKETTKRNELMENKATNKITFDINEIIPAAFDGKIDSLFVDKNKDLFGIYDMINRSLIIDQSDKIGQASLFNLAAVQSILKGGQVFVTTNIPLEGTKINALLRY